MNNILQKLKALAPHIVIIALFALLSAVYFSPVLSGKTLPQMDDIHAQGAAHELVEYQHETGELSQWTDAMFGGMPAYQIKSDTSSNIFYHLTHIIRLGLPYTTIAIVFLYLVGFYILMLSLRVNKWVALVGAVAFGLGSYNIIIIVAGHITKCYAIAMMPLVIGGVLMIFRGRLFLGGVFTMVSLGLELAFNHVQITYYLALALLLLFIFQVVYAVKDKKLPDLAKQTAALAVACLLAILPSTANLWTTYEYSAYSIRGASELKSAPGETKNSGLDKDYALAWSYGIHETPTLLVPNVVGGASEAIGTNLKAVQSLDPQIRAAVAQQSKYWGGRGFTSGPVYVGAIVCFLFFIGCFFYKGRLKWWLIGATILSILLAWGKNFSFFTDFMFYYFPLYNKFRTVEMALVIATVTIPMLAILGLKEIYDTPEIVKYNTGKFFGALGLSGGVALLLFALPTLFYDFLSPEEATTFAQLKAQNPVYGVLESGIIDARIELLRTDAMRSLVLIVLASSALWFASVRKINANIMLATVGILILFDLWGVDRRYLSSDNFVTKTESRTFTLSNADKAILADETPHRVMSLYTNPFNEVYTSYYHHSVGGYHGAKLRRYQDVIDRYLATDWKSLTSALQKQDVAAISETLQRSNALNILGTRYFIYNPQAEPIANPYALPEGWFVSEARTAADADESLDLLGKINPAQTAILEGAEVTNLASDSLASVRQTSYAPNRITYQTNSSADGLAVFSEIFYPAGWKATIDGQEAEILRADYILRALQIPAGQHEVVFSFEPRSFIVGSTLSKVFSVIALLAMCLGLYVALRPKKDTVE